MPKAPRNLATWGDRFWAWLIDFLIVGVFVGFSVMHVGAAASLIFLLYWTILENYKGQSIGKMALNLKVINNKGKNPTVVQAIIESFGKSFLLVIDVLVGWILFNDKKQRLFNKISDTYVIKLKK